LFITYDKDSVCSVWGEMKPILQRCVEASQGMLKIENLEMMLAIGDAFAMASVYDGQMKAVIVVRKIEYGGYNSARIIACAGEGLEHFMQYWDALEAWALRNDCQEVEGWCDPSMARLVQRFGFTTKKHIVTRNLRSKLQ
jgi:hypothetical protein